MLREVWTRTKPASVSEVAGLNSSARDYQSEVTMESRSPTKPSFGEKTSFSSRLRGFFVPPSDNNYTFYIRANDQADLFFSATGSTNTKVKQCPIFLVSLFVNVSRSRLSISVCLSVCLSVSFYLVSISFVRWVTLKTISLE